MSAGLPGLTGLDHVGFTVPDLEEARRFLVDVLGCEYLYCLGPFERDGEWMASQLNVDPDARMERLHFFRCGAQAVFEVFQYSAPRATHDATAQRRRRRLPCRPPCRRHG